MDGGVHHLSPMFDGTGYSYPAGFPKGFTSNTNGKIIASRVYFRTWDPPTAADANPWPGRIRVAAHSTVRTPLPRWRAAKCRRPLPAPRR